MFGSPLPTLHIFQGFGFYGSFGFDALLLALEHEPCQAPGGWFRRTGLHGGVNFLFQNIQAVEQAHEVFRLFVEHFGDAVGQKGQQFLLAAGRGSLL